jgi:hypothetical protein
MAAAYENPAALAGEDFLSQMRQIFENLRLALESTGGVGHAPAPVNQGRGPRSPRRGPRRAAPCGG